MPTRQLFAMLFCVLTTHSQAKALGDLAKAPPNFEISDRQAVFMDILEASHTIRFMTSQGHPEPQVEVASTIKFLLQNAGHPVFDLVPNPLSVHIGDTETTAEVIDLPNRESQMRLVGMELAPGEYTMRLVHRLSNGVAVADQRYLYMAYFMTDLADRQFLEQYLPTNLQFDAYPITIDLQLPNVPAQHRVMTNGTVATIADNHWRISFPQHFNCSSVYFHLVPTERFDFKSFDFNSQDGRVIPVTVYKSSNRNLDLDQWRQVVEEELSRLENIFGPWLHDQVLVYLEGYGGMEYNGATRSSPTRHIVLHELAHSYYARGVMPHTGNSGWLDEAVATWVHEGRMSTSSLPRKPISLAGFSPYRRWTSKKSYDYGSSLIAFLNHDLDNLGGMTPMLRDFAQTNAHGIFTSRDFQQALDVWSEREFEEFFDRYVWSDRRPSTDPVEFKPNPIHRIPTEAEWQSYLLGSS